jgi:hypothetical protein
VVFRLDLRGRTHRLLLAALGGFNLQLDTLTAGIAVHHLGVELEFQALLLQNFLRLLCDLGVHAGATDGAQEFDNRNLRAQTRPDRGL